MSRSVVADIFEYLQIAAHIAAVILKTGFLVNAGGATADDVLALAEIVRETVLKRSGFDLEPEVRIVGEPLR